MSERVHPNCVSCGEPLPEGQRQELEERASARPVKCFGKSKTLRGGMRLFGRCVGCTKGAARLWT